MAEEELRANPGKDDARRRDPPAALPPQPRHDGQPGESQREHERERMEVDRTAGRPADGKPPKPDRPWYKRPVLMPVLAIVVLGIGAGVFLWWWNSRNYVSTDDAFIAGDIIHISPRVAGRVLKVFIDDNQDVKAGDLLVQLDPTDFRVALEQQQAALGEAQSKLEQAKASVMAAEASEKQANWELSRSESLPPGAIAPQQLVNLRAAATSAHAQVIVARGQIKTAEAAVKSAEAKVEEAKLKLSYTELRAPGAGRITKKAVEPGDYVSVGQDLAALVRKEVWVIANFKEGDLKNMRPGQPATISIDAYGRRKLKGHVDSIQRGAGAAFALLPPENATGNYVKVVQRVPVKIVFDDEPWNEILLGPGMSVVPSVRVK